VNSFGIKPVNRKRHLCCPFCGGRSCRCRTCGVPFSFGSALMCASGVHGERREPLHCRCGARVGRFGLESGDKRTALCDVSPPLRLIERLRAHATRDN
jgi:hypothetical protein